VHSIACNTSAARPRACGGEADKIVEQSMMNDPYDRSSDFDD